MKLILITLVALVVGMMVACESASRTSMLIPTPSGPMYSEEEAIAVLKEHLQTKSYPRARQGVTCFTMIDGEADFWSANYDIEGRRWDVSVGAQSAMSRLEAELGGTPEPTSERYTWSVYERTKSIVATGDDPINQMC